MIDNEALKQCLGERKDLTVVLDVWEFEPDADPELIWMVDIATPHIAGYSLGGKIRCTEMIYQSFCQYFGLPARVKLPAITPGPVLNRMKLSDGIDFSSTCSRAIRAVYDIRRDDAAMRRALMDEEELQRKLNFDRLRKHYPQRCEFSTLRVRAKSCGPELLNILQALQFQLEEGF